MKLWNPFRKPPPPPPASKWLQPDTQWGVGDRCCLFGNQDDAGNAPPKDMVLIVSNVFEGRIFETNNRTVGLHFSNWPNPVNSDVGGWNALCFRKVNEVKRAEETDIGAKILKAKPAPDRKRKVQAGTSLPASSYHGVCANAKPFASLNPSASRLASWLRSVRLGLTTRCGCRNEPR